MSDLKTQTLHELIRALERNELKEGNYYRNVDKGEIVINLKFEMNPAERQDLLRKVMKLKGK